MRREAGLALVAAAVLVAAGAGCSGGESDVPAAASPMATMATVTATPPGIPTAETPTGAPAGAARLYVERRTALPPGTTLWVATGCIQCDGPDERLLRLDATPAGGTMVTVVGGEGVPAFEGWTVGQYHAIGDGSVLIAEVCDGEYCGAMGELTPRSWRLLRSTDGGATWEVAFQTQASRVHLAGASREVLFVLAWGMEGLRDGRMAAVWRDGTVQSLGPAGAGQVWGVVPFGRGVLTIAGEGWSVPAGTLLDDKGQPAPLPAGLAGQGVRAGWATDDGGLALLLESGTIAWLNARWELVGQLHPGAGLAWTVFVLPNGEVGGNVFDSQSRSLPFVADAAGKGMVFDLPELAGPGRWRLVAAVAPPEP